MTGVRGPRTRWRELSDGDAAAYQRRFDELASSGRDVHGEADLVASLAPPRARVLDAGCGTGRVATELTRRGFTCVGVDVEPEMVAVARERDPDTVFEVQDLTELYLRSQSFDLVVLAGNVVPLLAEGTLPEVMRRVAGHVHPRGLVVAGFGLDAAHLPPGCPVTPVEAYDRACGAAGLEPVLRFGSWERERWTPGTGYVVAVHVLR